MEYDLITKLGNCIDNVYNNYAESSTRRTVAKVQDDHLVIEYRTIGININLTPPPNVKKDAEKIQGVSKEFMEKEFPDYYQNKSTNIALQCQNLINIYGKRGWEHYFQGQIGNLILFYFKRDIESVENQIEYKLTPQEESLIQSLDESQRP